MEPIGAISTPVESRVIDYVDGFLGVRDEMGRTMVIDLVTEAVATESQIASQRFGADRLARLRDTLSRQAERTSSVNAAPVAELSPDTAALGIGTNVVVAKVHGNARLQWAHRVS